MADQSRWNPDRERAGRYGSDERTRRGYEDYGRRDYGADDWRSGAGSDAYGREGRSFGEREEPFSSGGGSGWRGPSRNAGSGEGRYGEDRYSRDAGRASYGQTGYGPEARTRAYGQTYDEGRFGYGGAQPYGRGGYGISAEEPQAYDRDRGADDGRTWMERAGEKLGRFFGGEGYERSHRGRGPKNYTRSDDRIREDVNDRLADDHWLDASEIEVQVASCEVTLSGSVNAREDRRRAEDLAEQVSGVRHVQNNLRVQAQTSSFGSAGSTAGYGGPSSAASTSAAGPAPIPGAATDGANGSATRRPS